MDPQAFPKPLARRRAKAVAKTQRLVGHQGTCRMYGFGVAGPDPSRSWGGIILGVVGGCVALALVTGVILVPGVLALYAVRWWVNKPRGVCIADQGIALTHESFWSSYPTRLLVLIRFEALFVTSATTKTHVRLQLGTEQIWLRRREHEILVAAANAVIPRASAPVAGYNS